MAADSQKIVTLTLPEQMVGQILDALMVREEAWSNTAAWFEGTAPSDTVVEECRDAEEARGLANRYREIIDAIQKLR